MGKTKRRAPSSRAGQIFAWGLTVAVALGAAALMEPDALPTLLGWKRLPSTSYPFAQLAPLRALSAITLSLLAILLAGLAIWRFVKLRAGTRLGVLALVFTVSAAVNWTILGHYGFRNPGSLAPDRGIHIGSDGDGTLTVFSLNTAGMAASARQIATAANNAGADILILPETSLQQGEAVVRQLAELGTSGSPAQHFQVFSSDGGGGAAQIVVLVSPQLGQYRQEGQNLTSLGSVLLRPQLAGRPIIAGVHVFPPLRDGLTQWERDLAASVGLCRPGAMPGLILAGDFNATRDHAFLRQTGICQDGAGALSMGAVGTWPTLLPTWLSPAIDHIYYDKSTWEAVAGAVVAVGGSDHRAVIIRVKPA